MGTPDINELRLKYRFGISIGCGVPLVIVAVIHVGRVCADYDEAGTWDQLWGNVQNPLGPIFMYVVAMCVLLKVAKFPAQILAHAEIERRERKAAREAERREQQAGAAHAQRMARIEQEHAQQTQAEMLAASKDQLIKWLGSIDQLLRAWVAEADSGKRALLLQSAQGVVTSMQSKLASGEIAAAATSDPAVRAVAEATKGELTHVGLGQDRLLRDLARMISEAPSRPEGPGQC